MAISTNGTVLARLAGALYNTQMSNATYSEVKTLDPTSLANTLYARDFASATDLSVATTLVKNLGLSSIAGLNNWVAAQLTAAGAANKGGKIVDLLNSFAQMTSDATYGAYATAFNSSVDAALALSQTTGNAGGTFAAAGSGVATFALTTGTDTQSASTFNAVIGGSAPTLTAFDSLTGTGSSASLVVAGDAASGLPTYLTLANIPNMTVSSTTNVGGTAQFDITGLTGITSLVATSVGTAADSIKAAATQNVTLTDTGAGATISGGLNDTVTAKGAISVTTAAGAVVVSDTATSTGTVSVTGGTSVSVTTKETGAVTVGGGTAATNPTGAVTVTDKGVTGGAITIKGGNGVSVTTTSSAVTVGGSVVNSQAGSVAVTQAYSGLAGDVSVDGGSTVSITTTGGGATAAISVGSTVKPTGAVTIVDTKAGLNADAISVLGGAAVSITTTPNSAAIAVGSSAVLDSTGTALSATNAAADPSGNVVINNSAAGKTSMGVANVVYGTGTSTVVTNGSSSVSITGGNNNSITDAKTTLATAGTNVGKAVGASSLTSVTLSGVTGTSTAVVSDALSSLTVQNISAATTVTVTEASSHALNVSIAATGTGPTITDNKATSFTVTDSGSYATGSTTNHLTLSSSTGAAVTLSNANKLTVDGLTMSSTVAGSITANGAGELVLGDVTGLTKLGSIDASTATGAVTGTTINGLLASFTGGAGNDVITVSSGIAKAINGGAGNNTLALNASAATYNGPLTPNAAISGLVTNFQTLDLVSGATGSYNSSGFTALQNDGSAAAVTYTNVAAGVPLTVTAAPSGGITYSLLTGTSSTNTFSLNLGTATLAADTDFGTITNNIAGASGSKTVSLTALGTGTKTDTVTLADNATGVVTTLNIGGTQKAAVTYNPGTSSAITAINVTDTKAVDISSVKVANTGATITGGAGKLTVTTGNAVSPSVNMTDSVVAGTGGAAVTVGIGGAGGGSATGSETVNLSASSAVQDTVTIGNASGSAQAKVGIRAVISGAVETYGTVSDVLAVSSKTALANVTTSTATASGGTYKASQGVITFGTTEAADIATQLADAQALVNAAGVNTIAAFINGGNTYVVSSDTNGNYLASTAQSTSAATATTTSGYAVGDVIDMALAGTHHLYTIVSADLTSGLLNATGATHLSTAIGAGTFSISTTYLQYAAATGTPTLSISNLNSTTDSLVQITGLTGTQGFGGTAASNTILTTGVTNLSNTNVTTNTAAATWDDTGYAYQTLSGTGGNTVQTIANLAASAELVDSSTTGTGVKVTTTQIGTSGTNYLTYTTASNAHTVAALKVAGDYGITLNDGVDTTYTAITDTTNTVTKITVVGAGATSLTDFAGTALTAIDASAATAAFVLGTSSPTYVSQSGLTVTGSTSAANSVYLSGVNDTVTIAQSGTAGVREIVTSTGANSTITLSHAGTYASGNAYFTITANGIGDTITTSGWVNYGAGNNASTISATGANDVLTLGAGLTGAHVVATLGSNATVTLGALGAGAAYVDLDVSGAPTADVSSGSYALTTIKGVVASTDKLQLKDVGTGTFATAPINVANVTTLAAALDLAATNASAATTVGTVNWFQYAGDTYIVENMGTGAATTGLSASDYVVKVTGLVDLSGATFDTTAVTLTLG